MRLLLTHIASLLIGAAFVALTATFSLSGLISATHGRAGLVAETFAVSYLACAAVAAALTLVLLVGERVHQRLDPPAASKPFAFPGRWIGFVTSPFLAPSVVAGDWLEAATQVLLVGCLIIGFLAIIMLLAVLTGARKAG